MTLSRDTVVHQSSNLMILDDNGSEIVSPANWHIYETGALIATGVYQDHIRKDRDGVLRLSPDSLMIMGG
jgi:hypothetical protein